MQLLYVACRWLPTVQNEFSGSDYGAYHTFKEDKRIETSLVGPFLDKADPIERIIRKIHKSFSSKRLIKYCPSTIRKSGKRITQAIKEEKPDVIFSKYSAQMYHVDLSSTPYVYMCDSTLQWTKKYWPEFSKVGTRIMEKWETKSIIDCDIIITFSHENAAIIHQHYGKDPSKIRVIPIPAYVPKDLIPKKSAVSKEIDSAIHLLLVGKRYGLRGIDIGIEVVNELNRQGIESRLTIVGINGKDSEYVKFMGNYDKEDPQQIKEYFHFFADADFLIHPSRFHAAGIVISEAAAFGLPTITNNVGGLATTVLDNETGIVLPEKSPATAYVSAIKSLIQDNERYQNMRVAARQRFDRELNWKSAGKRLREIVHEAALKHKA
jgi:glycosyltransferase involved in cell wall biosynthesis